MAATKYPKDEATVRRLEEARLLFVMTIQC